MIKAAIDRILELGGPHIIHNSNNDHLYTDGNLFRMDSCLRAEPIEIHSLSGLVDYISKTEDLGGKNYMAIVKSPTLVELVSELDDDQERETLIEVTAQVPEFRFERFIPNEEFIIGVQSKFLDEHDRGLLLKFAGGVKTGTVAEYGDTGVGQKATIRAGVSALKEVEVPNPCILAPYRTFTEVSQPASSFVFRVMDQNGEVACGLFEADGGAWKHEAMHNIAAYLEEELKSFDNILVIS